MGTYLCLDSRILCVFHGTMRPDKELALVEQRLLKWDVKPTNGSFDSSFNTTYEISGPESPQLTICDRSIH